MAHRAFISRSPRRPASPSSDNPPPNQSPDAHRAGACSGTLRRAPPRLWASLPRNPGAVVTAIPQTAALWAAMADAGPCRPLAAARGSHSDLRGEHRTETALSAPLPELPAAHREGRRPVALGVAAAPPLGLWSPLSSSAALWAALAPAAAAGCCLRQVPSSSDLRGDQRRKQPSAHPIRSRQQHTAKDPARRHWASLPRHPPGCGHRPPGTAWWTALTTLADPIPGPRQGTGAPPPQWTTQPAASSRQPGTHEPPNRPLRRPQPDADHAADNTPRAATAAHHNRPQQHPQRPVPHSRAARQRRPPQAPRRALPVGSRCRREGAL